MVPTTIRPGERILSRFCMLGNSDFILSDAMTDH